MNEKRKGVFLDDVYLSPVAKVMSNPELSPVAKAMAGIEDEPIIVPENVPGYDDLKKTLEGSGIPVDPDELARIRQHKAERRAAEVKLNEAARAKAEKDKAMRILPHQSHVMAVIEALSASFGAADEETRLECYVTARQHMVYAEQSVQNTIRKAQREAVQKEANDEQ